MKRPGSQQRPTLVLADDCANIIDACRRLLASEFDIVGTALGGGEAIDLVLQHDPDVLLLDLSMPDVSGVEVIEQLMSRGCRTRIVVLTLARDTVIVDRVLELGAMCFVTKTRMVRDLARAVRAALAGSRYRSTI